MPTATVAPTATPMPTATATAEEVAATRLSEILPWFESPPDAEHARAAEAIIGIWLEDTDLGDLIAKMPWVADGIVGLESSSLDSLGNIATVDVELANRVFRHTWFVDGLTYPEKEAVRILDSIAEKDVTLARRVVRYPSVTDGITAHESGTLGYLDKIATTDLAMASVIASYSWIESDITEYGRLALEYVYLVAGRDPALARKVAAYGWIGDEMTRLQSRLLEYLHRLTMVNLDTANVVASFPWVADDMLDHERTALGVLSSIAIFPEYRELAELVIRLPWVADDMSETEQRALGSLRTIADWAPGLARLVANSPWMVDDITEDEQRSMAALHQLAWRDVEFAGLLAGLSWIFDDITSPERRTIEILADVDETHPEAARLLIGLPWVADDITEIEYQALDVLSASTPEKARRLLEMTRPAKGLTGDPSHWNTPLLVALGRLDQNTFEALTDVSWLTDGVDEEEEASLVALPRIRHASPDLFTDLVLTRHTQSATISLPLTGEVDLWAFQSTPFPPDENVVEMLEDAVRATEGFLGAPFPTNRVVLLVPIIGPETDHGIGGGIYWGEFITATRYEPWPVNRGVIYHEVGHYYFYRPPVWLAEGGAEFVVAYTNDRVGIESLEDRKPTAWNLVETNCLKEGIQNIADLLERRKSDPRHVCNYSLGAYFLLSLLETLGEEATGAALGELFLLTVSENRSVTEEEIYRAFLKHTPAGLEEEFRDIYRRLHGGPYADE